MRTTRLIAGTVSAGLLGLTPIAIAAPSQAADTWTTTTVATPSVAQVEYGDDFYVSVDLASSDGYSPGSTDGTVTLMAQEAGSAAWVPVATAENTYASFYDVKPQMNTSLQGRLQRLHRPRPGHLRRQLHAQRVRALHDRRRAQDHPPQLRLRDQGQGHAQTTRRRRSSSRSPRRRRRATRSFKTIKTDKKGKYKVRLPRRGGTWYWSFTVKGDSKYLANGFGWRTWVS